MGVPAKRVDCLDMVPVSELRPGMFEFFDKAGRKDAGLIFVCPCGCGDWCALDFRPAGSPSWQWDGNREAPTLHPSVHRQVTRRDTGETKSHWHGWLRGGVWESC